MGQMIRTLGLETTFDCLRRLRLVWISHRHAGEWVLPGCVEDCLARSMEIPSHDADCCGRHVSLRATYIIISKLLPLPVLPQTTSPVSASSFASSAKPGRPWAPVRWALIRPRSSSSGPGPSRPGSGLSLRTTSWPLFTRQRCSVQVRRRATRQFPCFSLCILLCNFLSPPSA